MPDRRQRPGGYRSSVLGRIDWSCWLAAAGLLFLTVVSVFISFPILGVVTAILAVGLVVFDSWVNRPKGPRAAGQAQTGGPRTGTGWRSQTGFRGTPPPPQRSPRGPMPAGQPGRFRNQPQPARANQPRGNQMPQPPRRQPQRGMPSQQPPFRPQPGQANGQPQRGQQGQANGQPQRGQQGQPPRPPFRPTPPEPGRGRDYQARR